MGIYAKLARFGVACGRKYSDFPSKYSVWICHLWEKEVGTETVKCNCKNRHAYEIMFRVNGVYCHSVTRNRWHFIVFRVMWLLRLFYRTQSYLTNTWSVICLCIFYNSIILYKKNHENNVMESWYGHFA